jgi:hypothetical protein
MFLLQVSSWLFVVTAAIAPALPTCGLGTLTAATSLRIKGHDKLYGSQQKRELVHSCMPSTCTRASMSRKRAISILSNSALALCLG